MPATQQHLLVGRSFFSFDFYTNPLKNEQLLEPCEVCFFLVFWAFSVLRRTKPNESLTFIGIPNPFYLNLREHPNVDAI